MKNASVLTKAHLTKNKTGTIVNIRKWTLAVSKARKALSLRGFVPVNGKSAPVGVAQACVTVRLYQIALLVYPFRA